jgi:hypothetical protein
VRAIFGPTIIAGLVLALWWTFFRDNPGGMSSARYTKFQGSPAPKLLYSCTTTPTRNSFLPDVQRCSATGRSNCESEIDGLVKAGTRTHVDFVAGAPYDQLLKSARHDCTKSAGSTSTSELKILEGQET